MMGCWVGTGAGYFVGIRDGDGAGCPVGPGLGEPRHMAFTSATENEAAELMESPVTHVGVFVTKYGPDSKPAAYAK